MYINCRPELPQESPAWKRHLIHLMWSTSSNRFDIAEWSLLTPISLDRLIYFVYRSFETYHHLKDFINVLIDPTDVVLSFELSTLK